MLGYDSDSHRPMGLLSHYMTYSGVLMLVTCAAASRLLFYAKERLWPGIAVPALLLAFFALSPASIRQRAYSIVDPNDLSNRDRIQMLTMGVHMVRDHPFFGIGPEMVARVYGDYLVPNPVHVSNPHLHDVPMQIAAERGLIALAAWLGFVGVAGWSLFRQLRRGPAIPVAGAGAAALVAMVVAGLFEYNFGDSEFLILFLGLITLPYAATLTGSAGTAADAHPGGPLDSPADAGLSGAPRP